MSLSPAIAVTSHAILTRDGKNLLVLDRSSKVPSGVIDVFQPVCPLDSESPLTIATLALAILIVARDTTSAASTTIIGTIEVFANLALCRRYDSKS